MKIERPVVAHNAIALTVTATDRNGRELGFGRSVQPNDDGLAEKRCNSDRTLMFNRFKERFGDIYLFCNWQRERVHFPITRVGRPTIIA